MVLINVQLKLHAWTAKLDSIVQLMPCVEYTKKIHPLTVEMISTLRAFQGDEKLLTDLLLIDL